MRPPRHDGPSADPRVDARLDRPDGTTEGHTALNERGQKLLDRTPGFVFTAAGPVHISRDLGVLAFNMGVPEQEPAVSGIDVAVVRDGKITVLHTLLTAQR